MDGCFFLRVQRSERYTAATFLKNADITVVIDDRHAIAHNKIIIIDRAVLITGSFNFSKNADQNNEENLQVLKGNRPLLDRYLVNYRAHRDHSVPYEFAPKNHRLGEGVGHFGDVFGFQKSLFSMHPEMDKSGPALIRVRRRLRVSH